MSPGWHVSEPLPAGLEFVCPHRQSIVHQIDVQVGIAQTFPLNLHWQCCFVIVSIFKYREPDKPPISFYIIKVTARAPCVVIRLAFLGGTSGYERNKVSNSIILRGGQLKSFLLERNSCLYGHFARWSRTRQVLGYITAFYVVNFSKWRLKINFIVYDYWNLVTLMILWQHIAIFRPYMWTLRPRSYIFRQFWILFGKNRFLARNFGKINWTNINHSYGPRNLSDLLPAGKLAWEASHLIVIFCGKYTLICSPLLWLHRSEWSCKTEILGQSLWIEALAIVQGIC